MTIQDLWNQHEPVMGCMISVPANMSWAQSQDRRLEQKEIDIQNYRSGVSKDF